MHNSPWGYLNLDFITLLISHDIAVIIRFGSEFENAIIMHGHCFVTGYIITSSINFLLILYYHELSKHPWQCLAHLPDFLDIELAIHGFSKAGQDDQRLELC